MRHIGWTSEEISRAFSLTDDPEGKDWAEPVVEWANRNLTESELTRLS